MVFLYVKKRTTCSLLHYSLSFHDVFMALAKKH